MTEPEYERLPIGSLHEHEEVDPEKVRRLAREIARRGVVDEPIWVDRESRVILNGHHRFQALRALGVPLVPAWLFDYDDPRVRLELWRAGDPITKAEVIARARDGRRFTPKTTRHVLDLTLPEHPTPLAELGPVASATAARPKPARSR